jgi:hypothetical protein
MLEAQDERRPRMTLLASSPTRTRRPGLVIAVMVLLALLGIGAVGGGLAMLFGMGGESFLPGGYLDTVPLIDSWVLPGLVLLVGFGLGSLFTLWGMWARPRWPIADRLEQWTGHHWSWLATMVIGWSQVVWILLEFMFIPVSFLMPTFGIVGLALGLLPLTSSVRRYLTT